MLLTIYSTVVVLLITGYVLYLAKFWYVYQSRFHKSGSERRAMCPPGVHPKATGFFTANHALLHTDGFVEALGHKIYYQSLRATIPGSIIVMYHGYGDHSDYTMLLKAREFARRCNSLVFVFDQPGFGRSDGLWGFIPDWFEHVDICVEATKEILKAFRKDGLTSGFGSSHKLPLYAYGHSMGGGIAITAAIKNPLLFSGGLILSAPMCGLAKHIRPHALIERVFSILANYFETLPITPVADMGHLCYEDPHFYKLNGRLNLLSYRGRPRLGTAKSMLDAQEWLSLYGHKLTAPFLILHGDRDYVTSCESSFRLFNSAKSVDKEMEILKDYYHVIIGPGQPKEKSDRVMQIVVDWIRKRHMYISLPNHS